MTPPTANTIVLLPDFSIAQRRVPSEPSSLREVTVYTIPPAPPLVRFPAPSAPGKAATVERSGVGYSGSWSCSRFSSEQAVNDMKTDARKAPKKVLFMALVL